VDGAQSLEVDVTNSAKIATALAHAISHSSPIDILINSAGHLGSHKPFEEFDAAEWGQIILVNLIGVFEVTRQVLPLMRRAGQGQIPAEQFSFGRIIAHTFGGSAQKLAKEIDAAVGIQRGTVAGEATWVWNARRTTVSMIPIWRECMNAINLAAKLVGSTEHYQPRTVAQFNGNDVMLVKVEGPFTWHKHDETDDFFLVLKGRITIQLRKGDVSLGAGEMFVVPRGVEHCPVADEEAHMLLIEPTGTPNTGDSATAARPLAI
jgi:mannose-6-phosphate isomerase-like protein (cupin superfamily)